MNTDEFLSHHGVKGMKWGVRRAESRDARSARLRNGTASKKDKLIRDADIDGGRTQQVRAGTLQSTRSKAGMAFTATLLAAYGTLTLAAIKMG
jgi:hypothetical protein